MSNQQPCTLIYLECVTGPPRHTHRACRIIHRSSPRHTHRACRIIHWSSPHHTHCVCRISLLSSADAGMNRSPMILFSNLKGVFFSRTAALDSDISSRESHPFPSIQQYDLRNTCRGTEGTFKVQRKKRPLPNTNH